MYRGSVQDVRYGGRPLRRQPMFTAAAVFTIVDPVVAMRSE